MLDDFKQDLAHAKEAEELVREKLSSLTDRYIFEDISSQQEYYYKGDIKAISKDFGVEFYIEVKDDSRIADTKRVLCEEEVYMKDEGYFQRGNMKNEATDIYCVVSKQARKIYVFDFKKLKEIYKKYGESKVIEHKQQDTYCYLLDLCWCSSKGALLHRINY